MMSLLLGSKYHFTLASGKIVEVVIYGNGQDGALDISIDDVRGVYPSLNEALKEPYIRVTPSLGFKTTSITKEYAIAVGEWIEHIVEEAERKDPQLRPLKERINTLAEKIAAASDDAERVSLLNEQNEAIEDLMNHINSRK